MESPYSFLSAGLTLAWFGAVVVGWVLVGICAFRILQNAYRTATAFSDEKLRRRATETSVVMAISFVGLFIFPVVGFALGYFWPLKLSGVEASLAQMERGTKPGYRRALAVVMLFLGFTTAAGAGRSLAGVIGEPPLVGTAESNVFLMFFSVVLLMAVAQGLVLLLSGVRLARLWAAPEGTRKPLEVRAAVAVPAGWYADPWRQAEVRYWDGRAWTHSTATRSAGTQTPSGV